MGPYKGKITYPGQTQKRNATDHLLKDCNLKKCWKCGHLGHKGKECDNTKICNLCKENGHTYFTCPRAYSNRVRGGPQAQEHLENTVNTFEDLPPIEEVIKKFYTESQLDNDQDKTLSAERATSGKDDDHNKSNQTDQTTSSYEEVFLDLPKIIQKQNEQHRDTRTEAAEKHHQDTHLQEDPERRMIKETDPDMRKKTRQRNLAKEQDRLRLKTKIPG